jgi:hypothetical protein
LARGGHRKFNAFFVCFELKQVHTIFQE